MSVPRSTNKLVNQRILLIGGTAGVGISVAQALLEYGAEIILSSSREGKVQQVVVDLISQYPDAKSHITGYACDLASSSVEENITSLFVKVGKVNHVVYMAGDRLPMMPLREVTLKKWQKCNQVRTIAAILVAKICINYMEKSRNSSIIFTSGSICEKPIGGGWSMLACIGAGINGLTGQLALDLALIRVNAVAPGVIETDLWQGMGEDGKKAFFKQHEASIPTGKIGQPEDVWLRPTYIA